MIMLISFVGILTRVGRVTFASKEPMMGSVCLLYGKLPSFNMCYTFNYYF